MKRDIINQDPEAAKMMEKRLLKNMDGCHPMGFLKESGSMSYPVSPTSEKIDNFIANSKGFPYDAFGPS